METKQKLGSQEVILKLNYVTDVPNCDYESLTVLLTKLYLAW